MTENTYTAESKLITEKDQGETMTSFIDKDIITLIKDLEKRLPLGPQDIEAVGFTLIEWDYNSNELKQNRYCKPAILNDGIKIEAELRTLNGNIEKGSYFIMFFPEKTITRQQIQAIYGELGLRYGPRGQSPEEMYAFIKRIGENSILVSCPQDDINKVIGISFDSVVSNWEDLFKTN